MQLTLAQALSGTKSYAAPERGYALARAHELCRQEENTSASTSSRLLSSDLVAIARGACRGEPARVSPPWFKAMAL